MKNWAKILTIVISLGVIGSAIAGTLYHFETTKVSIAKYERYVAFTDVRFLEQYRKEIQQRIWTIQRVYPSNYRSIIEWQRLVEELRQIDMKIRAFYQKRGG